MRVRSCFALIILILVKNLVAVAAPEGTPLTKLQLGTYVSQGWSNFVNKKFSIAEWADENSISGQAQWVSGKLSPFNIVLHKKESNIFEGTASVTVDIDGVSCIGDYTLEIRAFSHGLFLKAISPHFYSTGSLCLTVDYLTQVHPAAYVFTVEPPALAINDRVETAVASDLVVGAPGEGIQIVGHLDAGQKGRIIALQNQYALLQRPDGTNLPGWIALKNLKRI
jgi:hypothetical protein